MPLRNISIRSSRREVVISGKTLVRGEFLGSGAFGEVYRWKAEEVKFDLAGKEVPFVMLESAESLQHEVQRMSLLDHKNIVRFVEAVIDSKRKRAYLFMELMETSVGHLAREKGIHEAEACDYTSDILHGLIYLHDENIIHCDIKGDNVLVANGTAKLADFGISKHEEIERAYSRDMTAWKGTLPYLSPELLDGVRAGRRSDVWALGCTVYEMLKGYPPFSDCKIANEIERKIVNLKHRKLVKNMKASSNVKDFLLSIFVEIGDRSYPKELLESKWME